MSDHHVENRQPDLESSSSISPESEVIGSTGSTPLKERFLTPFKRVVADVAARFSKEKKGLPEELIHAETLPYELFVDAFIDDFPDFSPRDYDGLYSTYQRAFEKLQMIDDPDVRLQIESNIRSIVFKGEINGIKIMEYNSKDNHKPGRISQRSTLFDRTQMLETYMLQPQLAEAMAVNQIVGGPGSNSASLIGVLKHGLRSQDQMDENEELVLSGEGIYGSAGVNRTAVSFAQWDDWREMKRYTKGIYDTSHEDAISSVISSFEQDVKDYPNAIFADSYNKMIRNLHMKLEFFQKTPKTQEEHLIEHLTRDEFPVIYLIGRKAIENRNAFIPQESQRQSEFAVEGGVVAPDIPIILVPQDHLSEVQALVEKYRPHENVQLFPIEKTPE